MKAMPIFAGALVAAAVAPALARDGNAALHGRLVDEAGAAVAGANIEIVHLPSNTRVVQTSAADGGFGSTILRSGGPYRLNVTAPGYQPAMFEVEALASAVPLKLLLDLER